MLLLPSWGEKGHFQSIMIFNIGFRLVSSLMLIENLENRSKMAKPFLFYTGNEGQDQEALKNCVRL